MRRFRFRLQKVQNLRRHQERAAKLVMAEAMASLSALTDHAAQIDRNIAACEEPSTSSASPLAFALQRGLMATRRRLQQGIDQAQAVVDRTRDSYTECRRALKSLTSLHERRREAWENEVRAAEQAEFDEIARVRFVAKRATAKKAALEFEKGAIGEGVGK